MIKISLTITNCWVLDLTPYVFYGINRKTIVLYLGFLEASIEIGND